MDEVFIQHDQYMHEKPNFDRLFRLGNIWIEKQVNCFYRRYYWIAGKKLFTDVCFLLNESLTQTEQQEVIEDVVRSEELQFFNEYKDSLQKPYLGI